MGLLVDGKWRDRWYDTAATGGRFVRSDAQFRSVVQDGGTHPPEAGRYHLYVAMACPWAHRTLLVRTLFGLESAIGVSVVHSDMLDEGWVFRDGHRDALHGSRLMHEVYTRAEPLYSGRVTVPVLWDCELDCNLSAGPDRSATEPADLGPQLEALAEAGVLEVAFGGGEALLREDLLALAEKARSLGLVPNHTTSGPLHSRRRSMPSTPTSTTT